MKPDRETYIAVLLHRIEEGHRRRGMSLEDAYRDGVTVFEPRDLCEHLAGSWIPPY